MKKISLFVAIFIFSTGLNCFALDWKRLHEEADSITKSQVANLLQSNPASVDSLYVLGLFYLNEHKDKEAKEAFEKVLSLQPDIIEAKWGVAEVLRRQHNIQEAQDLIGEVLKTKPDFVPAKITLAYIKYRQFDLNAAVRLSLQVIEQGRENVDLSNYTRAYLIYGGTKGMIAHYGGPISKVVNGTAVFPNLKKAQKLQPNSAAVMFGIGSFYLLAPSLAGGDLAQAEIYLKKAVEIDPNLSDAFVRLAQVYKVKGDTEKYNFYLNKALEIDPKNELALDIKEGKCRFICVGK
ncbi:MAG: tetratricopeptide repeat protein [Candidatus Omnitrophica bacterium]|nr:tetratricopeptide repeat protein [Candidatus Omnitrophota bacterium]